MFTVKNHQEKLTIKASSFVEAFEDCQNGRRHCERDCLVT
jgi:hypothetical protein